MTTLMFRNTVLETISHNGQIWFTSIELAKALEYSRVDSVTRIYDRNKDEFTPCMTETVNLTVSRKSNTYDNLRNKIRIFSLRGAHLIAMFANTPIAKEFRKWVLDILDREAANPIYQSQTLGDLTGSAATAELAALVDKLQRIIHEGEFIPAGSRRNYNLPANRKHEQTIIRDFLTKDESSTILMLLAWLRADGFDMTAAEREIDVIRGYVGSMRRSMGDIQTHAQYIDHAVRLVS